MSPSPDGSDAAARIASALGSVWRERTLPVALARGAALLAEASGAGVSALFVVMEDGVAEEGWHPREGAPLERARFHRAALEGALPHPAGVGGPGLQVERRVVPAGDAPSDPAPLTIAWVRETSRSEGGAGPELAGALLEAIAYRVGAARSTAHARARQEQYERWFKTLDTQLRILDRERQKFAAVANQADTYAFVTDPSCTVRWLNKSMAALLGPEGIEWTGRPCAEVCGPLGLLRPGDSCSRCPVREGFDSNRAVHREGTGGPGGRELYMTALPIKGPDGRALEVLVLVQDLTNLEVVRRAKERLEAVVSGAPIVLFAIDQDGVFTLSEGRGLEALGLGPGEVVGRSVYDVYRDIPEIERQVRRALGGETVTQSIEVGDLTFETNYGPLRAPDGTIQGVIGVATDVTERRRAERALQDSEERLRHAQRIEAVGSLAGGIAHDFNNLLTAMFGHLKFLGTRLAPEPELAEELQAIERAAERAAALTRQLLAFSRKQVLQLRVVDLNAVLREMEPMLRRLIREDIELRIEAEADEPWIRADTGQMEQVIVNLAVNARDAMPEGGRLTLGTLDARVGESGGLPGVVRGEEPLPPGDYVALVVRDDGAGMDQATQERAFEPFFTTKPVGEGTGLGLSTVYGIVKQSGGEVVLSSAPGEGTAFTLYFPRTEAPQAERRRAPSGPALEVGHETILLVEDERMVRELFRDVLVEAGYRVLEAAGGAEALAIAEARVEPIHLMVTDVVMPHMGGGELVQRMARLRPEVKVLYVSGYADDVLVRRGVIDSGVPFLPKPCMPEDLARAVRRVLEAT